MRAVILVGGEGTRMRPLTCNLPKPMLPVVNRPFLEHVISYLKSYGIDDVVLSMCYKPGIIQDHFGDGRDFGIRLNYAIETSPLGTAGAVKNAQQHVDDTVFVFNGDILTDLDLGEMLEFHRSREAKITIALHPVEDPTAYGLVETDPERRILRFTEKPKPEEITTNLINAGTYILEPEVLDLVPAGTFYMFERGLFPGLLQRGDLMYGYPSESYWIDIGTPQKYLTVHYDVLHGSIDQEMPGRRMGQSFWGGQGCAIDPEARVNGPVVLGDRVSIGPGAVVDGPTVIGDDCRIGAKAIVDNAVVWKGTNIGEKAVLKGCVIAAGCNIGAGASITDGAVLGDKCEVGPGNRLEKGIRLWPGTKLEANSISF